MNISSACWVGAGLVLPRHIGESQWLTRNGSSGDSLLLSSTPEGFTWCFSRQAAAHLRSIDCDPDEREDELYRLLLFYRDRRATESESDQPLSGYLVTGDGFDKARANEIINETIGGDLRPLDAEDLGLRLPGSGLDFDAIAAPAGLATLSWT